MCLYSLVHHHSRYPSYHFFLFNDPATTEIYTLSLHDALPISIECAFRRLLIFQNAQFEVGPLRLEFTFDGDRKSTRLNSSHVEISYAVFCLKKKKQSSDVCSCRIPMDYLTW